MDYDNNVAVLEIIASRNKDGVVKSGNVYIFHLNPVFPLNYCSIG